MDQGEAVEVGRSSLGQPKGFGLFLRSSVRQLTVLSRSDVIRFVHRKAHSGCICGVSVCAVC